MPRKKNTEPSVKPNILTITPEVVADLAEQIRKAKTRAEIDHLERIAKLMSAIAEDNPRSFAAFYQIIHGNEIPAHCMEWVETLYKAHSTGMGALIWASRGFWKTTTLSVTFVAYRIGKEPDKSHLVISSNDDSADKVTAAIAKIIEFSDGWKTVFPNVVPDKERAWGALGYEVKRKDWDYNRWINLNTSRVDPTFVGAGINTSRAVGKHPSGCLVFDDIHDEKNSISAKERNGVVKLISDTFMPTVVRKEEVLITWMLGIGTPWDEDDAYHYLRSTGLFLFHNTPSMIAAQEGEKGAVYIDGVANDGVVHRDLTGWWKLNWPSQFGISSTISARSASGKRGFARMHLLDLKTSKEGGMKYQLFPSDAIDYNWLMGGGVDYASIRDRLSRQELNRDYFAMAYIAKVPTGGAVVVDGVFGHYTQSQADQAVENAQKVFPTWRRAVIEDIGKGEAFVDTLLLKPHLRITPQKSYVNKHLRQEKLLGPLLEMGLLRISDRDSPFLNLLRKSLDDFPDGNDDVRDAVFWATYCFPELRIMPVDNQADPLGGRKIYRENPLLAFGSAGKR